MRDIIYKFFNEDPIRECPYGKAVYEIAEQPRPRGMKYREFLDIKKENIRIIQEEGGCVNYHSCRSCPESRKLLVEKLRECTNLFWKQEHVDALFEYFGAQEKGMEREFPRKCDAGDFITRYLRVCEDSGLDPQGGAKVLDNMYNCSEHDTCLECQEGMHLVYEGLLDLAENGKDGEWGRELELSDLLP